MSIDEQLKCSTDQSSARSHTRNEICLCDYYGVSHLQRGLWEFIYTRVLIYYTHFQIKILWIPLYRTHGYDIQFWGKSFWASSKHATAYRFAVYVYVSVTLGGLFPQCLITAQKCLQKLPSRIIFGLGTTFNFCKLLLRMNVIFKSHKTFVVKFEN